MEGKDQNLIYIIFLVLFFLVPPLLKLLTRKKIEGRQDRQAEDIHEDDAHTYPPEIPRPPEIKMPSRQAPASTGSVFSSKPIKPGWF
jgi:hypothetical protein